MISTTDLNYVPWTMIQAFFLFYSDSSFLSPVPESWLQKLKNFFSMMQMLTSPIVQILIKYLRKHFVLTRYDKNRIISKNFSFTFVVFSSGGDFDLVPDLDLRIFFSTGLGVLLMGDGDLARLSSSFLIVDWLL